MWDLMWLFDYNIWKLPASFTLQTAFNFSRYTRVCFSRNVCKIANKKIVYNKKNKIFL